LDIDCNDVKCSTDCYNIVLLSLYLPDGSPVNVFLSVFVMDNDDGICKIASPVFCLLVDSLASGILNYRHHVTWKRQSKHSQM